MFDAEKTIEFARCLLAMLEIVKFKESLACYRLATETLREFGIEGLADA